MRHALAQSFMFASIASATFTLTACGGGGSDTPTPTAAVPPAANPNAFPNVAPVASSYFVYTSITTPTLPAGQTATQRSITREYKSIAADKSFVRVDTFSNSGLATTNQISAERASTSLTTSLARCDFAPAYSSAPPNSAVVGDAYTAASKESCVTSSNGALTTFDLTNAGTAVAVEARTLPIGTFNAFKYSQTLTSTSATGKTTTLETCWIDTVTGRTVECASSYSTVPTGQTAATSTGSSSLQLAAYSANGTTAVGSTERRFAGTWSVTFAGSSGGSCAALLVDTSARISGSCQFLSSTGVATPFTVSGSVAATGSASVTASTGATLVGTFGSPSGATGTWVNGASSGTWSAAHQ